MPAGPTTLTVTYHDEATGETTVTTIEDKPPPDAEEVDFRFVFKALMEAKSVGEVRSVTDAAALMWEDWVLPAVKDAELIAQLNDGADWLAAPSMGAFIYPMTVHGNTFVTPKPGGDWTGSDTDGHWVSDKHKAHVMCLGHGSEWWAQIDGRWLNDDDGAPMAFATSRMAREQVEMRRKAEAG